MKWTMPKWIPSGNVRIPNMEIHLCILQRGLSTGNNYCQPAAKFIAIEADNSFARLS